MKKQGDAKTTTRKGLLLLLAFVLMLSLVPAVALAGTGETPSVQGGVSEGAGEGAGEATEPAEPVNTRSSETTSLEDPASPPADEGTTTSSDDASSGGTTEDSEVAPEEDAKKETQPNDANAQEPVSMAPLAAGDSCAITFLVWQDGDTPEDPTSFTGSSTATAEVEALFEGTIPTPEKPSGYSFVEWRVQGTGAVFDLAAAPIPGDITLYALYSEDSLADDEVDTFDELQSAIAAASDGVLTSIVLADTISITSTVTIPAGKKIRLTSASGQTFALNGGGTVGVLTVEQGATLMLENITITGGYRNHGGGIVNYGMLSIGSGAAITGNTTYAGRGGGVYNYSGGTLIMTGGVVSGNTSSVTDADVTLGGGGIYNAGTFTLYGGEIYGNNCSPAYYGGGVMNDGSFTMVGGTISSNTAAQGGGGVWNLGTFTMAGGAVSNHTMGGVRNETGALFTLQGGTISYNTNNAGSVNNVAGGTIVMVGGSISHNNSTQSGGGVTNSGSFTMNGGTISNNVAAINGGGVNNGGAFTVAGGEIVDNTATANNGGGICSMNSAAELIITSGIISRNQASIGGGISCNYLVSMSGGTISNNTAAIYGGGVYLGTSAEFTMEGSAVISGNKADLGGGVYNFAPSGNFTLNGGTLSENEATSDGGGIYLNNGRVTIEAGTISNNTAAANGGGIYVKNGSVTLEAGTISNNAAAMNGGGVWVTHTHTNLARLKVLAGVIFSDNVAEQSYDRLPVDDATYKAQIGTEGAGVTWSGTFTQGYNNYDISYVRLGYRVTYHENWPGGSPGEGTAKEDTYVYHSTATASLVDSDTLTKPGYLFKGWASSATATEPLYAYDQSTGAFTPESLAIGYANVNLYAVWEFILAPYTVEHYLVSSAGVNLVATDEFIGTRGDSVAAQTYTFPNYTHDATYPGSVLTGTIASDGSTVLKAYYRINTFTVTFVDWNGAPLGTQHVEYGGAATAPNNPSRDGYTFIGWDRDFSAVTSNLTVTAQYTPFPDPPVTYYTVTYLPGAYGTFTAQVTNGLTLNSSTPAAPAVTGQDGWLFTGWSPSRATTVTGNATYTAQWTEDPTTPTEMFTVSFVDWNGNLLKAEEVARGGNATAPADPTRSGYSFLRWDRSYTNVQGNITVTALYAVDAATGENSGGEPEDDGAVSTLSGDTGTPTINIGGVEIPLSSGSLGTLAWALLNLILAVAGVVLALITGIRAVLRRKQSDEDTSEERSGEEEQDEKRKRVRIIALAFTILLGIAGIIIFILTEDMTLPMVLTDGWTIVNLIVLLVEIVTMVLVFRSEKKKEESYDENAAMQNR